MSTHSPPINVYTHILPQWALLKNWVGPANLKIDEVTMCASLLTSTSSTIERISSLNTEINLGKYKHLCQVGDLNPGGQVPPQRSYAQFADAHNLTLINVMLYVWLVDRKAKWNDHLLDVRQSPINDGWPIWALKPKVSHGWYCISL
jgi:hypothetical protein